VVYLQADLDLLMARIAMRDRPYEREMEEAYIGSVRQAYEDHYTDYKTTPLLILNVNDLDFVRNPADLAYVEGRIRAALSEAGVRAWIKAASEDKPKTRQWPLVEEFLALTEAVGALGAAIATDPNGSSSEFLEALDSSQERLLRLQGEVKAEE
jgi:hypothetical protein